MGARVSCLCAMHPPTRISRCHGKKAAGQGSRDQQIREPLGIQGVAAVKPYFSARA